MRFNLQFYLLFLLVKFSPVSFASQPTLFFTLDSYSYSAPTSIDSFIHKFDGELEQGNHAVSFNQIELGVRQNNFSLSAVKRLDYYYQFSNDTARFYRDIENDTDFLSKQSYQLDLKMRHFEGGGIKLGYYWQINDKFSIGLAASYLKTSNFYNAKTIGSAIREGQDDFQIESPAYIYSNDNKLLEHPNTDAKGQGVTTDISVNWLVSERWKVDLLLKDAWSKFRWKDALYSQVNRWEVHRIKADGNLDTSPILEGRILDYTQVLPKKWLAKINYAHSHDLGLYIQTRHTDYFTHSNIGATVPIDNGNNLSFAWHLNIKAIELSYQMKYGYFRLISDSLNDKKAHAFSINTGVNFAF